MITKIVIALVFLLILFNLAMALFYMVKDRGKDDRTAKALTWRIVLSIAAFVLLLIAYAAGLIQPHGVLPPPPTP